MVTHPLLKLAIKFWELKIKKMAQRINKNSSKLALVIHMLESFLYSLTFQGRRRARAAFAAENYRRYN